MITDNDRTDQLILMENGFDETLPHQFGTGNDVGTVIRFDNLDAQPFVQSPLLRAADAGNLRMTVDDGWNQVFVADIFAAAIHAFYRDFGLPGRAVRQHHAAGHIARGINAADIRLHAGIYFDSG